jgi:hypothetical protein
MSCFPFPFFSFALHESFVHLKISIEGIGLIHFLMCLPSHGAIESPHRFSTQSCSFLIQAIALHTCSHLPFLIAPHFFSVATLVHMKLHPRFDLKGLITNLVSSKIIVATKFPYAQ